MESSLWLSEQVQKVLCAYPDLNKQEAENKFIIYGKFVLNNEYNGIPLYDEYSINVDVPFSFPNHLPRVRETSNALDKDYEHWYSNGDLCLGASCDLIDFVDHYPTLIKFFDGPLVSYFYSASYFKRYKRVPFGERSHGLPGIIEAYLERYKAKDIDELVAYLGYVAGICTYRGHAPCPCGSGRRLRSCHGGLVLQDVCSPKVYIYRSDAIEIIDWYIKEKKKRRNVGIGQFCTTKSCI